MYMLGTDDPWPPITPEPLTAGDLVRHGPHSQSLIDDDGEAQPGSER